MLGVRDAVLFEPRAWIDIALSTTFSETEVGGIIGRTFIEGSDSDTSAVIIPEFEEENEEL